MLGRLALTIALVTAGVALATVAGRAYLEHWAQTPLDIGAAGLRLEVRRGDSLSAVSRRLAAGNAIDYPRLLNLRGILSGADQRVRHGEYLFSAGTTPDTLLEALQLGNTVRYLLTLPEGIRFSEALAIIQRSEGIVPSLDGSDDPRVASLIEPALFPEGLFLPETYQYERGDSDLSILTAAHGALESALARAWDARDADLPYRDPYDLLTMASIVEKETGVASERAEIAGVFVRRLQLRMRLQTDPTVIYGLGEDFDGNLRRVHLRDDSNPYNSYRHHGLPPGPIALPGEEALLAAARPAPGRALYFVARGDGTHQFSETLQEHEEAVKRYQLTRRPDYRSSQDQSRP